MRNLVATALVATLGLAACTTRDLDRPPWTKPDLHIPELSLDETACRRIAARVPGTPESWVGGVADLGRAVIEAQRRDNAYERCMRSHGYARAATE